MSTVTIIHDDCRKVLRSLPAESVQVCVTSPPYWALRDYGVEGQIGLETTPSAYVETMVSVFQEVWRVLKPDGTLWLNLGDCYAAGGNGGGGKFMAMRAHKGWGFRADKTGFRAPPPGLKPKDLVGIPWRVALALQADGWYLRCDVIWEKPDCMPESAKDRPTRSHEYLFLLTKAEHYYYDADAIREPHNQESLARQQRGRSVDHKWADGPGDHTLVNDPTHSCHPLGRNRRSVWRVVSSRYPGAHFATFPEKLIEPCILASSRPGDVVLDPFFGSGTTGRVALRLHRQCIGIELNPDYVDQAERRTDGVQVLLPGLEGV